MSIKITPKDEGKMTIDLDNGHVEALKKITEEYGLLDEEKAVGFMLAVLSKGKGQKIEINGASFLPSDNIKKPTENV